MTIYTPYTYLIGWTDHDKWYYGVRFANKNPPEHDLWKHYHTSSNYVKDFRKVYGEPDVIQVRKVFYGIDSAVRFEEKVLRRLYESDHWDKWLNKSIGKAIIVDDDIRKKMTKPKSNTVNMGRSSEELSGKRNPFYGKKHTVATRQLLSKLASERTGWTQSDHQKETVRNYMKNRIVSDNTKNKISMSHNKVYTCPHCSKSGGRIMFRWHFDNCKSFSISDNAT